ncbi:hypothetical protein EB796_023859 [Bugula neritina]|uniref:Uncharacterized protein n=1 Tax=Bugula neritina TaxID=10212 RepID=A0A7J7IVH4_BUGNE|nr:hypothetical protein EB796_023859 [Bugula neritina]
MTSISITNYLRVCSTLVSNYITILKIVILLSSFLEFVLQQTSSQWLFISSRVVAIIQLYIWVNDWGCVDILYCSLSHGLGTKL